MLFLTGSLFLFIAHHFLIENAPYQWPIWAIVFWCFLFILHFIKVYITDRFLNKEWEREQINRLMEIQQRKIEELEEKIKPDDLK